ncbi:MAG: methyltransferase, partial [Hyphomicrobium sp.]
RLLMSQKFQHLAAKIPISRGIARKSSGDVFDLVAGFVYSQILLACVQLRLFDHLRSGTQTLDGLAQLMGLRPDAAQRLLAGAAALGLVTSLRDNRYCLGFRGAAIAGNAGVMRMIEHHSLFYADMADPVALLRGEVKASNLSQYWSYCVEDPHRLSGGDVAGYTQLMSQSQALVSGQILDAYPVGKHHKILDIGGGEGTFLLSAAERAPHLEMTLFDVPAVAERARKNFEARGLNSRATAIGGDFFLDPLPQGADLISLVRIVHDHDDDAVMLLLRRLRQAIAPGGTLLIAEPMAGADRAAAVGDAYFNFYLMAMGSGRARTAAVIGQMLVAAGFEGVAQRKTNLPLQCSLVIAHVDAKKRKANLTSSSVSVE